MPPARERKKRSRAARPAPGRPAQPDAKAAGPARPADPPSIAVAGFELSELRRLIRLVQRTGIGELELNAGGRSVRISATPANGGTTIALPGGASATGAHAAAAANRPAAAAAEPAPSPPRTDQKSITSPMVGTFYRSPAPDADPFVEVGDVIEVGQTVCIIEAMKLMNEIEAETKGRVAQILVENTQPVEFGQKLFLIDPL
jgi:acetyl-CoA carboxylase biotin carboxyl carrier protein